MSLNETGWYLSQSQVSKLENYQWQAGFAAGRAWAEKATHKEMRPLAGRPDAVRGFLRRTDNPNAESRLYAKGFARGVDGVWQAVRDTGINEKTWIKSRDPYLLLHQVKAKASPRKLRLLGGECCRRMWVAKPYLLEGLKAQQAIEVAEESADGQTPEEPCRAHNEWYGLLSGDAWEAHLRRVYDLGEDNEEWFDDEVVSGDEFWAAQAVLSCLASGPNYGLEEAGYAIANSYEEQIAERAAQAHLVRCVLGNPFRPPLQTDASVLAWNDSTVLKLATVIYASRDWSLMPILANALEDAGVPDASILEHLRGPGPHARGCWVLDLLLGRA